MFDLMDGLSRRNHDVRLFSSEDVQAVGSTVFSASAHGRERISAGKSLLWNAGARALFRKAAEDFQPDVIHYHSIYHQLSPSLLGATKSPTVMTLHDYKVSAPCYTLYRDGNICTDCVGKPFAISAIRYRCISSSVAASALCAVEDRLHRHRYRSAIDRFIVPSKFAFNIAVAGGLPTDRITIVPWGVATPERTSKPVTPNHAFFGARLHRTKGLDVLLDAWRSLPHGHQAKLRVAGEGELEQLVRTEAARDSSIEYLGVLSGDAVINEIRSAAVAIVPSLFPETMGLSALEAMVGGTPILSSGRGALADLAGPGVWTLASIDVATIRGALVSLLLEGEAENYRRALATRDLSMYQPDRMIDSIEREYGRVTEEHVETL